MKCPGPRLGWEITVTRRGLGPFHDPRGKPRTLGAVPDQPKVHRDDPHLIRGSAVRPRHTPWPSTVIWRWRWELGLVTAALLLLWASWLTTGAWVLAIAPIVVSALTLIQPCQRFLHRRGTAIAVQHRIRGGFAQGQLYGPDGELPAVLWTRLTPQGERIYLWSPPSLTVNAFRAERSRLTRACRSQTVGIEGHSKFTRIVILDVVRRGLRPAAASSPALAAIPRPRQRQEA